MMIKYKISVLGLMLAFLASPAIAKENVKDPNRPKASTKVKRSLSAACDRPTASIDLSINNVRARILNGGDMWWDLNSNPRYEVPKIPEGSNEPSRHAMFAGSIWIGGQDNGLILTAAMTYRQSGVDFWPGPIDSTLNTTEKEQCNAFDQIFSVTREEINDHIKRYDELPEGQVRLTTVAEGIKNWPGKGNTPFGGVNTQSMAPYVDRNGRFGYQPEEGDYPNVFGDQSLWFVYNDIGDVKSESRAQGIGIEIQTQAFAFATNDEVNNMTFYENVIVNRGSRFMDSTYFGQWADPDLGFFNDDYVGCDVDRGLGICFNGDDFDDGAFGYGANPPSVGVDFFQGPLADLEIVDSLENDVAQGDGIDNDGDGLIDERDQTYWEWFRINRPGEPLPAIYEGDGVDNDRDGEVDEPDEEIIMSKFVYYNNDGNQTNGNPFNLDHYYNYLRGLWKQGECVTFDGRDGTNPGECADFMFPSDPRLTGSDDWSEVTAGNPPGDRRFLQSAGPFTLKPGAVNKITVGLVWAKASSGGNLGSLDLLKLADDEAQKLFFNNFDIIDGPLTPELNAVESDREIVLYMTDYLEAENYEEEAKSATGETVKYQFQGYQIFQLSGPDVSAADIADRDLARQIFQCDLKDGFSDLTNTVFDPVTQSEVQVPQVSGADDGVVHSIKITEDAFATGESRLVNYKEYYFLLIAYAKAENSSEKIQYLRGRLSAAGGEVGVLVARPQTLNTLAGGAELRSSYEEGPEITRIEGTGNGGLELDLTKESIDEILANGFIQEPTYEQGHGPLNIKVLNPLKVLGAEYEFRIMDSTKMNTDGEKLSDNFEAEENAVQEQEASVAEQEILFQTFIRDSTEVQNEINRLTELIANMVDGALKDELQAQLDEENAKKALDFSAQDSRARRTALRNAEEEFISVNQTLDTAKLEASRVYWQLDRTDLATGEKESVTSEYALYHNSEMVLDFWGLSIQVGPTFGPLESENDPNNGYLSASMEFENETQAWLTAVADVDGDFNGAPNPNNWIRAGEAGRNASQDNPYNASIHDARGTNGQFLDPQGVYSDMLGGRIAPYLLTAPSVVAAGGARTHGPRYKGTAGDGSLTKEFANFTVLPNVDLVLTKNKANWTRCAVVEMGENPFKTEGNAEKFQLRQHPSVLGFNGNEPVYADEGSGDIGYSFFPGYAINVETGERMNIIFGENSSLDEDNVKDLLWNPSDQVINNEIPISGDGGVVNGGMHYIYIMNSSGLVEENDKVQRYVPGDDQRPYKQWLNSTIEEARIAKASFWGTPAYVMPAFLEQGYQLRSINEGIVPNDVKIRLRVNHRYSTFKPADKETPEFFNLPYYRFSTENISPISTEASRNSALDKTLIVPNPYYGISQYERQQLDNIARITGLPATCTISIYTVNGALVRKFEKDESYLNHTTYLDWDLKNTNGISIASGVYLIHVDAGPLGSKTIKWFAIMKPLDLDTF